MHYALSKYIGLETPTSYYSYANALFSVVLDGKQFLLKSIISMLYVNAFVVRLNRDVLEWHSHRKQMLSIKSATYLKL